MQLSMLEAKEWSSAGRHRLRGHPLSAVKPFDDLQAACHPAGPRALCISDPPVGPLLVNRVEEVGAASRSSGYGRRKKPAQRLKGEQRRQRPERSRPSRMAQRTAAARTVPRRARRTAKQHRRARTQTAFRTRRPAAGVKNNSRGGLIAPSTGMREVSLSGLAFSRVDRRRGACSGYVMLAVRALLVKARH